PVVSITRVEAFSSAHRLWSSELSAEENANVFGKCTNKHGHNYKVEVTIRGPVDPITGMVMNLVDLKKYMHRAVMDTMDHKDLDEDVEYFKTRPSTAENVAVFIWEQMVAQLPDSSLLHEVKLYETPKNIVLYHGQ
ncbi:uncharacterized protein MONBRDRAFT_16767, partial [Monosiga brevicollis MX1]